MVDHTPFWKKHGEITKVDLYFSKADGCVYGIKPTYGQTPVLLGAEAGLESTQLKLKPQEQIRQMQIKAGRYDQANQ